MGQGKGRLMPLLDYIEFEVHMGYSGLDAK